MLFPIPTVERTAPAAAGLPDAEEHVLTTADGEKVIVWHVPAKARPSRGAVSSTATGIFWPAFSRFKAITADGTGLVALSYRGYAGLERRTERGWPAAGCRGRLCLRDGAL